MEGMVQAITKDCAESVETEVNILAELNLVPNQDMRMECIHNPNKIPE